MDEYKQPYLILFRACEEAIRALDQQNYGQARELLVRGEQIAEEFYMALGEDE